MSEGEATANEAPAKGKSIVDPKYRDKYKNAPKDFVALGLDTHASATKEVKSKVVVNGEITDQETTKTVVTGVDVDKLFAVAKENNLDVAKYENQRDGHGFPGRFRMTVANMLRAAAKQRHGLTFGGVWTPAPAEWLTEKEAPDAPTHTKAGEKIAKPKVEKEAAPAKAVAAPTPADAKEEEVPNSPAKGAKMSAGENRKKGKK